MQNSVTLAMPLRRLRLSVSSLHSRFRIVSLLAVGLLSTVYLRFARADAPVVQVGEYTVRAEQVARVLDLTQKPGQQAHTVVFLTMAAKTSEALAQLTDLAEDPMAKDDRGEALGFRRLIIRDAHESASAREVEIWFSGAAADARQLETLSGSLTRYERKETMQVDFLSVVGEEMSPRELGGLTVAVESWTPGEKPRSPCQVEARVRLKANAGEDVDWTGHRLELIDGRGVVRPALATDRTYQYSPDGELIGLTLTATFPPLGTSETPRGIRYVVERLSGRQVFPYRFENLPLP